MNIEEEKVNIEEEKVNIEKGLENFFPTVRKHVKLLKEELSDYRFGRSDVEKITGLKAARTSALIKEMNEAKLIVPIIGHGKGKYKFR